MATSDDLLPIHIDELELTPPGSPVSPIQTHPRAATMTSNSIIQDLLSYASNYRLHYQQEAHRQHKFIKTTFYKLTYCQHCGDMLWGLHKQGFNCMDCNLRCHERCKELVVVPCLLMKLSQLRKPNSHWFKEIPNNKKVYCNVCRHRISGTCLRCEVCKYYVHSACMHPAVSDCLDSSTYNEYYGSMLDYNYNSHHWVEGNLPANARCIKCDRNCGSADCLMDVRCVRCGILVHTFCLPEINSACKIGLLRSIFLSPTIVTVMLTGDDATTPIQGTKTEMRFSPITENVPIIVPPETENKESDEMETLEISGNFEDASSASKLIKVWDYTNEDTSLKITKTMRVYEHQKAADIIPMILKKFRIFGYPSNFHLVIPASPEEQIPEDEILSPEMQVFSLHSRREPLNIYLKFRKDEGETYALKIHTKIKLADAETVTVEVTPKMTVATVIKLAVKNFHVLTGTLSIGDCYIDKYLCHGAMFKLDRLQNDDDIWVVTADDRKHVQARYHFTRYFLKKNFKEEFYVAVTKLPPDKTKEEYKSMIISKHLEDKVELLATLDIHGLVILKCVGEKTVFDLVIGLRMASFDNHRPCTLVLPTIHTENVAESISPLLVFVNSRSGGGQGKELISALRRHLNPHQIFDLNHGGPYPGIFTFKNFESFRVLICGGDGTYGWVLQALDETQCWRKCIKPECALLPLGTGNDLARAFNWGAGYSGEKPMDILCKIDNSYCMQFDRWTMVFDCRKNPTASLPREVSSLEVPVLEQNKLIIMNNYFGIGCDAEISLAFHEARERHPEKFSSRIYNKFQYAKLGAELMIENQTYNLQRDLSLQVDDKNIEIASNLVGIVVLNINSWGAGGDAWGPHYEPCFQTQEAGDGKLEVAGVTGTLHMIQIQKGLGHAIRLAQGSQIKISTKTEFPVQVDGEPWRQPSGSISIFPQIEKSNLLMYRQERRAPKIQKSVSADVYMV